jgi:hypothetical protein
MPSDLVDTFLWHVFQLPISGKSVEVRSCLCVWNVENAAEDKRARRYS